MQIEKILPAITGGSLAETLHQLNGSKIQGVLFEKSHFLQAVEAGWIKPTDWKGQVLLEQSWSDTTPTPLDLIKGFEVEEVLIAHGFEADLTVWRDLVINNPLPMYLVLQPTAMVKAEALAETLKGQPLGSVFFDFSHYSGDRDGFAAAFSKALPELPVRNFPCAVQKAPEFQKPAQPEVTSL